MRLQLSANAFDAEEAAKAARVAGLPADDDKLVVDDASPAQPPGILVGDEAAPAGAAAASASSPATSRATSPPLPAGGVSTPGSTADGGTGSSGAALLQPPAADPAAVPKPVHISAAIFDLLPTDVINETAAQFRSGFGLTHKWAKRKEEERKAIEAIRNPVQRKRSRFASKGSAGAPGDGATSPSSDGREDEGAADGDDDDAVAVAELAPVPGAAVGGGDGGDGGVAR